jgi:phage gpG-like protein
VVNELGTLPRKLSVQAAPLISAELRSQFVTGVDPYGSPWAPLKPSTLRKHGPPPLTDTRRLRDNTKATPMTGGRIGIIAIVGAKYGAFHQVGFRVGRARVPARRILPNRGMPAAWRRILDERARFIAARARGAI